MMRMLKANLRLFFDGAYLSYVALFRWLAPRNYIASKIVMPLSQLLFFSILGAYATGESTRSFYVIGNAVQLAAVSGIYGVTFSVGGDRFEGTLPYLFGTPANRMVMFIGRAFMHVIDGMLGVVIGLMWGVLLLGLDLTKTDPLALALIILITTFSTSGLGLLLGCISLVSLDVIFINNTVYFALLIFSGANLNVSVMPGWMQAISQALPLTRGIQAARAVIGGASLADVSPLLLGEFLIGAIYVFLGYSMFRWFAFHANQPAPLEAV